jgi:CRP/FNR family transcriptional regulator, anaerobic regulatory protein
MRAKANQSRKRGRQPTSARTNWKSAAQTLVSATNRRGRNVASVAQQRVVVDEVLARTARPDSTRCDSTFVACAACELSLCSILAGHLGSAADQHGVASLPISSVHTVPARRTIFHPKEWSEFVPIICSGWSVSSIALPDGRRQILSFLLPGDAVSTAFLFGPLSGRFVEAVTEVTYRKFKRSDLRAILFDNPELFDRISKTWIEERVQADQLALDLGRRTASERIARQILNLAERLAKRGMMRGQTMEFPLRQRHIADATGLTPVHVSKVLGEFQRARLIEISSRSLTILNETELRLAADWR